VRHDREHVGTCLRYHLRAPPCTALGVIASRAGQCISSDLGEQQSERPVDGTERRRAGEENTEHTDDLATVTERHRGRCLRGRDAESLVEQREAREVFI
jgi:hypothetical protein